MTNVRNSGKVRESVKKSECYQKSTEVEGNFGPRYVHCSLSGEKLGPSGDVRCEKFSLAERVLSYTR